MIHHEVITTEKVPFTYRVAGLGSRFLAWLIDVGLIGVLSAIGIGAVSCWTCCGPGTGRRDRDPAGPSPCNGAISCCSSGFGTGRRRASACWACASSRGGAPPSRSSSRRVRNVLRVADSLPVFMPWASLVAACNRQHRRLGDLAAGTLGRVHGAQGPRGAALARRAAPGRPDARGPGAPAAGPARPPAAADAARPVPAPRQLPLRDRARLFRETASISSAALSLTRNEYQSDEKFVLQLAALLGDTHGGNSPLTPDAPSRVGAVEGIILVRGGPSKRASRPRRHEDCPSPCGPEACREGRRCCAAMFGLLKETASAWIDDKASTRAPRWPTTACSPSPIVILAVSLAGLVYGADAARGKVAEQIQGIVGKPVAEAIESLVRSASDPAASARAAFVSLAVALFGAATLFVELQDALNTIWNVRRAPDGRSWPSSASALFLRDGPVPPASCCWFPDRHRRPERRRQIPLARLLAGRRRVVAGTELAGVVGLRHAALRPDFQGGAGRPRPLAQRLDRRRPDRRPVHDRQVPVRPVRDAHGGGIRLRGGRLAGRGPGLGLLLGADPPARRRITRVQARHHGSACAPPAAPCRCRTKHWPGKGSIPRPAPRPPSRKARRRERRQDRPHRNNLPGLPFSQGRGNACGRAAQCLQ